MCDFKKMFNFKNEKKQLENKKQKRILEKAQAGDAEAQYLNRSVL